MTLAVDWALSIMAQLFIIISGLSDNTVSLLLGIKYHGSVIYHYFWFVWQYCAFVTGH